MSAVVMRVRAELRAGWRAWLALALVLGVAAGAATAAAAGARRTETAYPRFVERSLPYHVILGGTGETSRAERVSREIADLPMVAQASRGTLVASLIEFDGVRYGLPEIFVGGGPESELIETNIPKIVEGRLPDPTRSDDLWVDFFVAERLGLEIDDRVTILLDDQRRDPPRPPRSRVGRIVGIGIPPYSLPAIGQVSLSGIQVTPAFWRENVGYLPKILDAPSVRLRRGVADIPAFRAALRRIEKRYHTDVDEPVDLIEHMEGVAKTLRFDVAAQWLLAALIVGGGLLIVGQALARQTYLESGAFAALRGVGMSRGQLLAVGMFRAAIVGVLAALVAVVTAFAASPLTPRGLVRLVEPDAGLYADLTALGIGAAGTLLVALAASILPSWRASRVRPEQDRVRVSGVARGMSAAGASPAAVAGTLLALEPGSGRSAVPVRSAILGIGLAVASLVAAATFTKSFENMLADTDLQGYAWDAVLFALPNADAVGNGDPQEYVGEVFANDSDVDAFSLGGSWNVRVAGRGLIPFVFEPGRGIEPVVLEGRAPRGDDEVALGTGALRAFGKRIGDEVNVTDQSRKHRIRMRIVGRAVVPAVFFESVEPGFGSAITMDAVLRLNPEISEDPYERVNPYVVRFRDGVDLRAKLEELRGREDLAFVFPIMLRGSAAELSALSRSSGLPVLLTQVLLLMAVATLAHALVTSIRKRRPDLAVLKTLGFVTRQVRATVAWQATLVAVIALAIGVPAGIAVGRWGWTWFANTLGLVPVSVTPMRALLVFLPLATLSLANLIAAFPARSAARTRPAVVLRTE